MLFNTLAYARFFAVVFVVAWTLVSRRWALALPWFALAGTALTSPGVWSAAAVAIGALATLGLELRVRDQEDSVPLPAVIASVAINGALLQWLTFRERHLDPLSVALGALRVPLPHTNAWHLAASAIAIVLAVLVVRARKVRILFLLGSSYVFYAYWDWRFLPLIWASSTIDWLLGNAIGRARDPERRKLWLLGTVVVNLGVLAVFKYANFGIDSVRTLFAALGHPVPESTLRIALPIGVSFFTFESMSYVIDIYRRELDPHPSYLEYLCFVAFFPHLVAGPIVRPRDLLPQLGGAPRWDANAGSEALFLIAIGLFKKVAIGDYLALNLVDRVFDAPLQFSGLECYAGVLGYAVQIYCDFSGYTDIAIGSALLLGVRFPLNFDAPYKATNIADFWRRWHISLSSWLRDYLYIPLGGNRKGQARTYLNLMLTMLLGGLWHGANWTFVAWGGLHGAALAATRAVQDVRGTRRRQSSGTHVGRVLSVIATFHLVCAAWIFFRSESFGKAWLVFERLASLTTHHANLSPPVLGVLALGLASHYVPEHWYSTARSSFVRLPAPAQGIALFFACLALRMMASAQAVPFVYFQF